MCKVLAFTNTKKIKLSECLNDIGNYLLMSEKDGFGYAVQGENGVFGEKTIAQRFATRIDKTDSVQLPVVKPTYSAFGTPASLVGPGLFHGRTSTNVVDLNNTHPMYMHGWHLIHNGVVGDYGPFYNKNTENDSEDLLKRLIDGVGKSNPMGDIEQHLEGYYAFMAIDPTGNLHVARDGIASLFIAFSSKYDTYIIGTTEALIQKVDKLLDAKIGPIDEVYEEVYFVFKGNEMIHCQEFKSRGFTTKQSQHATASIGRSLSTGNNDVSESAWQNRGGEIIEEGIDETDDDDDTNIIDLSEDSYYNYKKEVDNMDASYDIYDIHDKPISLWEYKKLDHIHQELCTIIRGDGTVVDPEAYHTLKLHGRRA